MEYILCYLAQIKILGNIPSFNGDDTFVTLDDDRHVMTAYQSSKTIIRFFRRNQQESSIISMKIVKHLIDVDFMERETLLENKLS
uniref:Uncharacterized protein n=1 Tax=Rhizophora mucronata TaxID=61149 RepID=A0A2P2QN43_RHIMU